MQNYDYLVIGGGSAGIASALHAASLGKRVVLIEQTSLGGVCLHHALASIGFTEAAAREYYGEREVRVYQKKCVVLYSEFTKIQAPYWIKWICVGAEDRIMGCHALGLGSDEIIQWLGSVLQKGMSRRELLSLLSVHPSCSEDWLAALE